MEKEDTHNTNEAGRGKTAALLQLESAPAQFPWNLEPAGAVSMKSIPPTSGEIAEGQQSQALNAEERSDLKRMVGRFKKLQGAWFEGSEILLEIRGRRLFRDAHDSFESFCRKVLGLSKSNVNRSIQTAEVAARLATIVAVPERESHIRPLLKLEDADQQVECYRQAREVASAEDRAVKASDVAKAVQTVLSAKSAAPAAPSIKSQKVEILARLQRSLIRGLEGHDVALLLTFEQDMARFREAWLADHVEVSGEENEAGPVDEAEHHEIGDDHD